MKKVFLSLALVAAMSVSFVSCKETKTETEETVVAPETEVAPEAEMAPASTDTMSVETTTTTAETPAGDASATTTTTEAAK